MPSLLSFRRWQVSRRTWELKWTFWVTLHFSCFNTVEHLFFLTTWTIIKYFSWKQGYYLVIRSTNYSMPNQYELRAHVGYGLKRSVIHVIFNKNRWNNCYIFLYNHIKLLLLNYLQLRNIVQLRFPDFIFKSDQRIEFRA